MKILEQIINSKQISNFNFLISKISSFNFNFQFAICFTFILAFLGRCFFGGCFFGGVFVGVGCFFLELAERSGAQSTIP